MTKRTLIAAAWVAGTTIPVLVAAVFLIGCCVLPFHGVNHHLMPICQQAAGLTHGEHGDHDHDARPVTPARAKEEPVKRVATEVPDIFRVAAAATKTQLVTPAAATAYRSFITLGAVRCDRDVGLHLLVVVFLI